MKLPHELENQLIELYNKEYIEKWEKLSQKEKEAEIIWCIEKCYINLRVYPEKRLYFCLQIKQLEKLEDKIKEN